MSLDDFPWQIGDTVKFIRQWEDKGAVIPIGSLGVINDIGFERFSFHYWVMTLNVAGKLIELVPINYVIIHEDESMNNAKETQVGFYHYRNMKIQPVEFITANSIPYLEGNVIKYICRHRSKGGSEDLKKAKHYIDLLLQHEYPDES